MLLSSSFLARMSRAEEAATGSLFPSPLPYIQHQEIQITKFKRSFFQISRYPICAGNFPEYFSFSMENYMFGDFFSFPQLVIILAPVCRGCGGCQDRGRGGATSSSPCPSLISSSVIPPPPPPPRTAAPSVPCVKE